jgi:hypothetical protein
MEGPRFDRKHVNCLGQYDVMNPESPEFFGLGGHCEFM